jgi:hypothetical protein
LHEEAKDRSCCTADRVGFGRCEDMEGVQEKGRGREHGGRNDWTSGQDLERGGQGAPRVGGRTDWTGNQELERVGAAVLDDELENLAGGL